MENKNDKKLPQRRSIRLKGYDYRQEGLYFITLCCKNREYLLGEIKDAKMELSPLGEIAEKYWQRIPDFFPQVILHEFVIMPNHLHGIIEIIYWNESNVSEIEMNENNSSQRPKGTSQTIGSIVRGFKSGVTSWAKKNIGQDRIWQRDYYEHIIRNDKSHYKIAEYIINNPIVWDTDKLR